MTSLEGEDPSSSKTQKRIADGIVPEISSSPITRSPRKKKTRVSFAPRVTLSYPDDGGTCEEDTIECAETALSFWNEKSLSKQGPQYELVDALSCIQVPFPIIYHCNFTARPKDESAAESELFFGELRYKKEKDGKLTLTCRFCCIIGPCGTVTGLRGCKMCELNPSFVQHPKKGRFFKKKGGLPNR